MLVSSESNRPKVPSARKQIENPGIDKKVERLVWIDRGLFQSIGSLLQRNGYERLRAKKVV